MAPVRRRAHGAPDGHRPGPPRLGLQGAAGPDRGRPQARPAALRGRHLQPRARHRHGRGRPGRPDRVAAVGGQRPAAGRPRRPPGRRGLARRAVPQAPRRPGADRGRRRADARRRRSRRCSVPDQPARRARPAGRRRDRGRRRGTSTTLFDARPPRRAVRRRCRARRTTRRSTCSPAATRPTSSPSCGRASSGTGSPARSPAGPGAQRLAVTSGGTIPDRGLFGVFLVGEKAVRGSASSTRRWSTSPGSATCSRSATSAGGSRTSPTTGCWSPPRPASPGGCRSGRATRSAGPPSSAPRSARSPARWPRCRPSEAASARPAPGLDAWAADNLVALLAEQREATGYVPARPHARWSSASATSSATGGSSSTRRTAPRCTRPWALAIGARLRERYGIDAQAMAGDDGIVLRIPETDAGRRPAPTLVVFEPDEIERPRHRPRSAARRCSPPASASARPGRCCCRAATPAGARRCGSSGSARRQLLEVAAQVPAPSRSSSRRSASACRTSTTCRRWSA